MSVLLVLGLSAFWVPRSMCQALVLLSLSPVGTRVGCCMPWCRWDVGVFFHTFGIYGYQGADNDPEKLAVSEKCFQATLAESEAVGSDQPVRITGDCNVLPSKLPCVNNMISAEVDIEFALAHMKDRKPAVTCKTSWPSNRCTRMDSILACHWLMISFRTVWKVEIVGIRTSINAWRWEDHVDQVVT